MTDDGSNMEVGSWSDQLIAACRLARTDKVLRLLSNPEAALDNNLADRILDVVDCFRSGISKVNLLEALARHLPEDRLPRAIRICSLADEDGHDRMLALVALANVTPSAILPLIDEAAQNTREAPDRLVTRIRLLPFLPETLHDVAAEARLAKEPTLRSYALTRLMAYMPDLLFEALDAVIANPYETERANMLCDILLHTTHALAPRLAVLFDGFADADTRETARRNLEDQLIALAEMKVLISTKN